MLFRVDHNVRFIAYCWYLIDKTKKKKKNRKECTENVAIMDDTI